MTIFKTIIYDVFFSLIVAVILYLGYKHYGLEPLPFYVHWICCFIGVLIYDGLKWFFIYRKRAGEQ